MFRRSGERPSQPEEISERVDSVLGAGISWQGQISGTGGIRIDGAYDGEIALRGLVVIGEAGRVTCEHIRAATVVVAGSVKGDLTARRVEITRTGRVWGNVVTTSLSTEEGAFLKGEITMQEQVDLGIAPPAVTEEEQGISGQSEEADQPKTD